MSDTPTPSATGADRLEDVTDTETGMTPREAAKAFAPYVSDNSEICDETVLADPIQAGWAIGWVDGADHIGRWQKEVATLRRFHASRSARMAEQLAKAEQANRDLEMRLADAKKRIDQLMRDYETNIVTF